jgi:hypothetical protein
VASASRPALLATGMTAIRPPPSTDAPSAVNTVKSATTPTTARSANPEPSLRTRSASRTAAKASSMMPRLEPAFLVLMPTAESAPLKPPYVKNVKPRLSEWKTSASRPANMKKDFSSKMSKDPSLLKTAENAPMNAKLARI